MKRIRAPSLTDLADLLLVARAVEHDDRDVADVLALALGDALDHLGQLDVEAEHVGDLGVSRDLLHVDAGTRIEHRPSLRERDHRQRRRHSTSAQRGPLERVDSDVDLGRAAIADAFAVVEHRRVVLLALADDDEAVHRHGVEQ